MSIQALQSVSQLQLDAVTLQFTSFQGQCSQTEKYCVYVCDVKPGHFWDCAKQKIFKKRCLSKHHMLPVIRGTVGSAWGTVEEVLTAPPGLQIVGLLLVLFPLCLFMVHS